MATYMLQCFLVGDVRIYHRAMVRAVADEFGLEKTRREDVPSHFTLKYWFKTEDIAQIESLLRQFCLTHNRARVRAGGFGGFPPNAIFIKIELSTDAKQVFEDLVRELRAVSWMPWDQYDAERLHFHMTVAEECGDKYASVLQFLASHERCFDVWFDNISILEQPSGFVGGDGWQPYKTFYLQK